MDEDIFNSCGYKYKIIYDDQNKQHILTPLESLDLQITDDNIKDMINIVDSKINGKKYKCFIKYNGYDYDYNDSLEPFNILMKVLAYCYNDSGKSLKNIIKDSILYNHIETYPNNEYLYKILLSNNQTLYISKNTPLSLIINEIYCNKTDAREQIYIMLTICNEIIINIVL